MYFDFAVFFFFIINTKNYFENRLFFDYTYSKNPYNSNDSNLR